MSQQTFIIHTSTTEQENALKALVKDLKMKIEVTKNKTFLLSSEQQNALDSQLDLEKKHYSDAEKIYADLKIKHGL